MFFSSNKSKSLYLKLGFSFFILIFITTILQTSYTYFSTKKELYSEIENNINVSLKQLENSVITFVESYQVNNYNRIIKNEMAHQNLLAIIELSCVKINDVVIFFIGLINSFLIKK